MKRLWLMLLFLILIYTRLVGLNWGIPYSLHPDELKMAYAVLDISSKKIYSSYFWAYGAFHINVTHVVLSALRLPLDLPHVVIGLRLISAFFSLLTALYGLKIVRLVTKNSGIVLFISTLLFIFSPALIQFAHFGTTENILMWSYTAVIYYSLLAIANKKNVSAKIFLKVSFVVAIGAASKIIALSFLSVFFLSLLIGKKTKSKQSAKKLIILIVKVFTTCLLVFCTTIFFTIFFSPHYLLHFKEFIDPLLYEKKLGSGEIVAFYTRQFFGTKPILFQFQNVFPYALGVPVFVLTLLGLLLSPNEKKHNIIRFGLLLFAATMLLLFTKWTRNLAPIFPLCIIISSLFLYKIYSLKHKLAILLVVIITIIAIIPGVAFLSIYHAIDVRFKASDWIFQNIPAGSSILSETANGIDVPVQFSGLKTTPKPYNLNAFNFYEVDGNPQHQRDLRAAIQKADYIFVPSRRVFANHGCFDVLHVTGYTLQDKRCIELKKKYPMLNDYYEKLFSGNLGFKQIAEINSYPKISLFGKTILEFPDERAEETWTVFDHPVIRIYKRI